MRESDDTRRTRGPDFPGDLPERDAGDGGSGGGDPHARTEHFLGRRTWRDSVAGAAGLLVLAGAWLVVSPLPISYAEGGAEVATPLIAGGGVIALAVIWSMTAHESVALPAALAVIGAALAVGGGWAGGSEVAEWNLRITGAVIVFLAFSGAAAAGSGFLRQTGASAGGSPERRHSGSREPTATGRPPYEYPPS